MLSLTAVPHPSIPSVNRVASSAPTPLFEATVRATGTDPRRLFESPLGSGKCSCTWAGHGVYNSSEGKGGRIGRTHHS